MSGAEFSRQMLCHVGRKSILLLNRSSKTDRNPFAPASGYCLVPQGVTGPPISRCTASIVSSAMSRCVVHFPPRMLINPLRTVQFNLVIANQLTGFPSSVRGHQWPQPGHSTNGLFTA